MSTAIPTRRKTLIELAGAPLAPSPFNRAALVLIDFQREYTEGGLILSGASPAVAAAATLLERARGAGTPVFHVVHHGRPGATLFNPEGPMSAIVDPLTPRDGETIIVKGLPNAFANTRLAEALKATGRRELITAGFMTHMCLSATVRAGLDHGYRSTVVAEACGTRDLPDPLGGVLEARAVHRVALAELADRFAIVVPVVTSLVG